MKLYVARAATTATALSANIQIFKVMSLLSASGKPRGRPVQKEFRSAVAQLRGFLHKSTRGAAKCPIMLR